ncbi:MAG: hypothetical protein HYV07_14050 [Deltaproteobacteria bacterium]|nr:hypothetical protein [Deltaproteobacteria bacterium]
MTTKTQLENTLRTMPGVDKEKVEVVGDRTLVATVVSGSFRDQDEADRQAMVWRFLRERIGSDALQNIEFIFTNAPDESAPQGAS